MRSPTSLAILAVSLFFLGAGVDLLAQTVKKKVGKESDLPRFTYLVHGSVADLVQSDPDTFSAFARKVRSDLQTIFDNYETDEKATKRALCRPALKSQILPQTPTLLHLNPEQTWGSCT